MKGLILILLLTGCAKQSVKPTPTSPKKQLYEGVWWSENYRDSLVISFYKIEKDSVKYFSTNSIFNSQLTHVVGYEPKDDNLILKDHNNIYSFRIEH